MKTDHVWQAPQLTIRPRVMIAEARFYADVTDMLAEGALSVLEQVGATVERFAVPGALELPAAVQFAAKSGRFDAFVVLGCIIRGETTHYDTVSLESNAGLTRVVLDHDLCLGNAILTVENKEQALDRADPARQNKGAGAAWAALTMLSLKLGLQAK